MKKSLMLVVGLVFTILNVGFSQDFLTKEQREKLDAINLYETVKPIQPQERLQMLTTLHSLQEEINAAALEVVQSQEFKQYSNVLAKAGQALRQKIYVYQKEALARFREANRLGPLGVGHLLRYYEAGGILDQLVMISFDIDRVGFSVETPSPANRDEVERKKSWLGVALFNWEQGGRSGEFLAYDRTLAAAYLYSEDSFSSNVNGLLEFMSKSMDTRQSRIPRPGEVRTMFSIMRRNLALELETLRQVRPYLPILTKKVEKTLEIIYSVKG